VYNEKKTVSGKEVVYGNAKAINFTDNSTGWSFITPFPGAVSQPIASKGILLFLQELYLCNRY